MIRIILIFFTLLSVTSCYAQKAVKRSEKTEVVNGKKYYLHTIEKKETLYSISKTYEVSANDIVTENPDLIDGLKPGVVIRIPVKGKDSKDAVANPAVYSGPTHVVQKGETMYSLCKKYNVTPEELMALNPELKDGVKLGMLLKLPDKFAKPKAASPTASGDSVKPFNKDTSDLHVAFLLPLYTELNTDDKEYKDENEKPIICPKSNIGVSFYEGARMALDSLRKLGFSAKIHTYDTEHDSDAIDKILAKPEMKEMDLIIGPLYASNFKKASDFAKKNQIPLVSPFSQVNKILLGNPFIFKATPSVISQVEELACHVRIAGKEKIIYMVNSDNPKDRNYYETFRKRYNSLGGDSIKELSIKRTGLSAIETAVKGDKEVWVIATSNDQVFVTDILNKLIGFRSDKIRVFGLESWVSFENLDPEYLMKLHVTLCLPQFVSFEDERVKNYLKAYRAEYKTDPDRYSFQGFDVTWFFCSRLKESGRNFMQTEMPAGKGFQNNFLFIRTAIESGFENKTTNIVEYIDYRFERIAK